MTSSAIDRSAYPVSRTPGHRPPAAGPAHAAAAVTGSAHPEHQQAPAGTGATDGLLRAVTRTNP